ncbi:hypothetical protein RRG08_045313 [Elysia crispata]|uniref:Uncharacterized protein n=1 Tax=Elysia crispata TaxID=231223 RepID=A0AAE1A2A1_9GAST|nr:hypothetical protein RRG08_045313 [Elysia crispata]
MEILSKFLAVDRATQSCPCGKTEAGSMIAAVNSVYPRALSPCLSLPPPSASAISMSFSDRHLALSPCLSLTAT